MPPSKAQDLSREEQRARVRRNQQAHRERRQSYLKELERKWGSCLQLGAQASVEVQQAAKLVVAENNFLRKLLEEHGLNKDYVDKQIHQFRQGQPTNSTVEEEASPLSVSHAHLCAAKPCLATISDTPSAERQDKARGDQAGTPTVSQNYIPVVNAVENETSQPSSSEWDTAGWTGELNGADWPFERLDDAFDSFMATFTTGTTSTDTSGQPFPFPI